MIDSRPKTPMFYLQLTQMCRKKLLKRMEEQTLHDFRTSLRRLEAILRLEKSFLGKKQFHVEIKPIKNLQSLTGPFRDFDVASNILKSLGVGASTEFPNVYRQGKKVEDFQSHLAEEVFDRALSNIKKTIQRIEKEKKNAEGQKWIKTSFEKEWNRFRKALGVYKQKGSKPKILHRVRIRAKRIRYDLELFDFLHLHKKKKALLALNEAQESLGKLRDWQRLEKCLGVEKGRVREISPEIIKSMEKELRHRARKALWRLDAIVG